jgi:CRISPR-associated exonuclease Cas4
MYLLYLSILFSALAVVLFIVASHRRRQTGLPPGKVIYIDTSQWGRVDKPLFDPNLRLTGRPDYLIKQGTSIIPVEVKSRRAPASPHDSHIFQVAAYCLLVEHAYGKRPDVGVIHYADKTFAVDFTDGLEKAARDTIHEMQECADQAEIERSHQDGRRCQHCGYRSVCDQALRI